MTNEPTPEGDKLPDAEAEERFNRTLGNLANMAPAPRGAGKREPSKPDSRPVSAPEKS